ncbi:Uncharacterised protein [Peptoniphilus harei]|uniref:Uncharacterized protein n=1 Tax=Peptoniphilus harei TaxID=54005 RepID=A0A2X1WPG5_9FIRM|nr:Uncharacterised protein [Peptoniphilus harei]
MGFKTDIQIADEATMLPIEEVAAKIGFEKTILNNMVNIKLRFLGMQLRELKKTMKMVN